MARAQASGRAGSTEEPGEPFHHAIDVASGPVDPVAARASFEIGLGQEYVLGHEPLKGLSRPSLEPRIALEATRQPVTVVRGESQPLHRFENLVVDALAADQAAVWLGQARQHAVAGDEDARLVARDLEQMPILG